MKQLLSFTASLGLVVWAPAVTKANDLFNPTLDVTSLSSQNLPTPTGWTVDANLAISGGSLDAASSETFCNVLDPGGYGLFFKAFRGDQPSGDLLTVNFYQDNPTTPGTKFTLSGYAGAEANYCGFFSTNSPAPRTLFVIEFLDGLNTVLASNAYNLVAAGLPSGGAGTMALFTTPQFTAPLGTVTVRAGASMLNAYNTSGSQGFFVDAFDLESVAPPGSPVITNQPVQKTVSAGATTTFTVGISNTAGASYQWQLYGTNLANGGSVSGATSQTLTITGVSASDVGHYRVRVSNAVGTVFSKDGTLAILSISFYPVISITGKIGDTYRVDYANISAPTTFFILSTNLLTTSPQLLLDTSSQGSNTRIYRAVFLY